MPLVWGNTRIIPFIKEDSAQDKQALLIFEFMTGYKQLRHACPKGDLRIHLSVEGSPAEVGADQQAFSETLKGEARMREGTR